MSDTTNTHFLPTIRSAFACAAGALLVIGLAASSGVADLLCRAHKAPREIQVFDLPQSDGMRCADRRPLGISRRGDAVVFRLTTYIGDGDDLLSVARVQLEALSAQAPPAVMWSREMTRDHDHAWTIWMPWNNLADRQSYQFIVSARLHGKQEHLAKFKFHVRADPDRRNAAALAAANTAAVTGGPCGGGGL